MMKCQQPGVPEIEDYLPTIAGEGFKLGFDGRIVSFQNGEKYAASCEVVYDVASKTSHGSLICGAMMLPIRRYSSPLRCLRQRTPVFTFWTKPLIRRWYLQGLLFFLTCKYLKI